MVAMNKLTWSTVSTAIEEAKARYGLKTLPNAFSYCVLDKLFPNAEEDIKDLMTDGGNDCGIDAVKISRHGTGAHVHLFQFKYCESIKTAERYFSDNAIDKVLSYLERLFDENEHLEQVSNPALWDKTQEIWDVHTKPNTKITVHFCSNGTKLQDNHRTSFVKALEAYGVTFEEIDFSVLHNLLVTPEVEKTVHSFTAINKEYFGKMDGDIRGMVATISAGDLINIIQNPDNPTEINARVFDQNIRMFLGKDNPVNETIIQSALSSNNDYFWYMSNGLTAVCSSFSHRPSARNPIVEVENLQIVNGAQTSYALFEAHKQNPNIADDVLFLIRVYETKNAELPNKIAIATNSQTRIYSRDLMSNSSLQVRLEAAFKNIGYYYERKKNQYIDKPSAKRIDSFKLGQAVLSYHLREPERAKRDSNQIFGTRYEEIFNEDHSIEILRDVYLLYQELDSLKDKESAESKKGALTNTERFLTYGLYHILYLIGLLAERKNLSIDTPKNRSALIKDALDIMRGYLKHKNTSNYYNLFRNPRTKEEIYDVALDKGQLEFKLELVSATGQ